MRGKTWTRASAVNFINALRVHTLTAGYDVALAGSVLHNGVSHHDLDVVIYPLTTAKTDRIALRQAMSQAGMTLLVTRQLVVKQWRAVGSRDRKWVEVWQYKGRRVDVFLLK